MTGSLVRRDIAVLVLLFAAAACDGRAPIGDPKGGAAGNGAATNGAGSSGAAGAAGTAFTADGLGGSVGSTPNTSAGGSGSYETAGTAGTTLVFGDTGGASGSTSVSSSGGAGGSVLTPAPCSPTTIANPAGGLGGGCFADNGPYANVPKDPSNRCPCSRAYGRANPPAGIYCPPGTGAGGEVVIGPEGGTLALPGHDSFGGQVSLVVPPGALSQPTKLTMTELPVPTPIGYTDLTPIYDLEPAGLKLAAPAKLVMYWDIYQAAGASLTLSLQGGVYESLTQLGSYALLPGSSTGAGMSFAAIDTLGFVFASYPATLDPAYCLATAGGLQ